MTREDLLERFDGHEVFEVKWTPFIKQQLAQDEDDGGFVAIGTMPKAPGARHDKRGEREALSNEAEVRLQRIANYCQLGRQEVANGDGDRALFYEHQAYLERCIVEPMLADLQMRADATVTGAKGGANSWKPRKR